MGWAAVGLFIWARADGDVDAYAGPAGCVSSLIQSSGDSVQGQVFFVLGLLVIVAAVF